MPFPSPGEEREFLLVDHLRVVAQWEGFPGRNPEKTATSRANPAPGWVVLEIRVVIHNSNNGGANTNVLVGGAEIISKREVEEFYQEKIDAAYKDGDKDLAARLEQTKSQHLKYFDYFYTNKNLVEATVRSQGHGHAAHRKRGWQDISVYAKCMYLGLPDNQSLLFQSDLETNPLLDQSLSQTASVPIARSNIFSKTQVSKPKSEADESTTDIPRSRL